VTPSPEPLGDDEVDRRLADLPGWRREGVENHYDRVRIGLHTWSADAITEKDLELAAEVEAIAGSG
jgi:pterin-4a-carbinolamine dehydratase